MMGYPHMGQMMGGGIPPGMHGGMPPGMSGVMPPQIQSQSSMSQGPRTQTPMPGGTVQQTPTVISRGPKPATDGVGPSITVFVGNITDRAPDNMIRQMLTNCGPMVSWKRVQGASGVLQGINFLTWINYSAEITLKISFPAFGFCEYSNPESALRAIRLLHDLEIGDKKLVVKVDAKTKVILDNYKGNLTVNVSHCVLCWIKTNLYMQPKRSKQSMEQLLQMMMSFLRKNKEFKTNGLRKNSAKRSKITNLKCKQTKPEVNKA